MFKQRACRISFDDSHPKHPHHPFELKIHLHMQRLSNSTSNSISKYQAQITRPLEMVNKTHSSKSNQDLISIDFVNLSLSLSRQSASKLMFLQQTQVPNFGKILLFDKTTSNFFSFCFFFPRLCMRMHLACCHPQNQPRRRRRRRPPSQPVNLGLCLPRVNGAWFLDKSFDTCRGEVRLFHVASWPAYM